MRRQFLRAPLDFTRISSNFNPRRRHPILNTIRAHKGVDYAAPTGTVIKAAGDGRVSFVGTKGGYGRVVILEHGGGISTLYGHMSRFAARTAQRPAREAGRDDRLRRQLRRRDRSASALRIPRQRRPQESAHRAAAGRGTDLRAAIWPSSSAQSRLLLARLDRAGDAARRRRPSELMSQRAARNRCNTSACGARSILGAPPVRHRPMLDVNLKAPEHYINRELSFLDFNQRVLAQAHDESLPLLERIRFLGISCSNLDEFFEIRVAGLKQRQELGSLGGGPDGMSVPEQLAAIHERALALVKDQYELLNQLVFPALAAQGIQFVNAKTLDAEAARLARRLLREGSRAGSDAARPRSGATVSAHSEQEPELHRAPVGQGRVRARCRARGRAGAALAAANHPPAPVGRRAGRDAFRVPVGRHLDVRRAAVQRHEGRRRLAVSRHAQQRSVRRRRRSRQPAARRSRASSHSVATAPPCVWRLRSIVRRTSPTSCCVTSR